MKIVGVGCGPGMLTEEAVLALKGARRVYGSRRAIELARVALPRSCEIQEIRDYSSLDIPDDAILLSTGDPMLAGLGDRSGEVIPGISSLQLAFARLRLPLVKVAVVDGHSRDPGQAIEETAEEVLRGKIVFILPDPSFPMKDLSSALKKAGISCTIALCEDLGYPAERITLGTPDQMPVANSRLFSLLVGRF
ncbi:MAG: cobalt-precorrin-7 (C(5))-methyltransferase [Methanomicrobiales archaeon]|nr:cobalt-precorrin-7 (C(5))-methyltransferase [Methanomicrobiales archaeon]MDD1670535.1 cobalt-precorrin-7 (C(5))-methyltransferase [Methanomicrobiales archaeon]